MKVSWTIFELWSGHEFTIVKFQRGITPELYAQELRFLCSARCLMMLCISMKYHENILNSFQVIEQTLLRDERTDRRTDNWGKNNVSPHPLPRQWGDIITLDTRTPYPHTNPVLKV